MLDVFLLKCFFLLQGRECSGILVEHDMNDLLFFSPDRFGVKIDRSTGLGDKYVRRIEPVSKHGSIVSSSEACFSVLCSPRLSKDATLVITTSIPSLTTPSDNRVESSGNGVASEHNSM